MVKALPLHFICRREKLKLKYKKNILVIDDSKPIRDILWFSLKQEGYKAFLAESGMQGLKILFDPENQIDLVILDVMMPKMDGYQVLKKLRSSNQLVSNIPVIMLTAKSQKEDVLKGIGCGVNDYIVKPYKFPDLLAKIQYQIG